MTLSKDGYPLDVLDSVIHDVIKKFHRVKPHFVDICPVYWRLPYIGTEGEILSRFHVLSMAVIFRRMLG